MGGSQWQISPGFAAALAAFLLLLFVAYHEGSHHNKLRTRAQIIAVRSEEHFMATALTENALRIGGLTNLNQQFVFESLTAGNQNLIRPHINAVGEIVDIWQTPYRITLAGPTNFVFRSAGPNKKFGDKDDIVFNSALNSFVQS